MPCYDPRNTYDFGRQEVKYEIDKLTRMLCGVCTQIEKSGDMYPIYNTPELGQWWKEHKILDKKHGRRK